MSASLGSRYIFFKDFAPGDGPWPWVAIVVEVTERSFPDAEVIDMCGANSQEELKRDLSLKGFESGPTVYTRPQ